MLIFFFYGFLALILLFIVPVEVFFGFGLFVLILIIGLRCAWGVILSFGRISFFPGWNLGSSCRIWSQFMRWEVQQPMVLWVVVLRSMIVWSRWSRRWVVVWVRIYSYIWSWYIWVSSESYFFSYVFYCYISVILELSCGD